jgi:hypothetical protein
MVRKKDEEKQKIPSCRIASKHPEAVGEELGDKVRVTAPKTSLVITCPPLVVMGRSCILELTMRKTKKWERRHTGEWDYGVHLSIGVVVVQLGYPVVAVVNGLVARCFCGIICSIGSLFR